MKTIRVTGTGRVAEAPDTIEIPIFIETTRLKYDEVVGRAEEKAAEIADALVAAGFRKEDLKLMDYRVDTDYETYYDKNNCYKKKFKGYRCSQNFSIEFPMDMHRLSLAVNALGKCERNPEFSIRFKLKNTDAAVRKLLENAAESAAKTASILCRASGAELGSLQTIDYSWSDVNFYSESKYMTKCLANAHMCEDMEYEPADVEMSENVTFIWEIV